MDDLVIWILIHALMYFRNHLYRLCFRFIASSFYFVSDTALYLPLFLCLCVPNVRTHSHQHTLKRLCSVLYFIVIMMMCNVFEIDMVSFTTELFILFMYTFTLGRTNERMQQQVVKTEKYRR